MTGTDPLLASLERRVRWLTAVCVFLGLGLMVLIVKPFFEPPAHSHGADRSGQPDVRLRSLTIADSTGVVRLQAGLYENGSPFIRLNGTDGEERFAATVRDDGEPEVRLHDTAGKDRARLELDPTGRGQVRLSDIDESPVVMLNGRGDGGPVLVVRDAATGETLFSAPQRRRRQAAASR